MPLTRADDRGLTLTRRLAFGVGHVLNDLCASVWFSYLLIFLQNVMCMSNVMAGNIMLIGQVSDALFTPIVGIESDKSKGFCKYGKRKSFHVLGTLCVLVTFPFLFIRCIGCVVGTSDWAKLVYYAPFVVIFQFGWATVQIAHMALVTDLTGKEEERIELNAIRYAWTVISNITVYVITWILLGNGTDPSANVNEGDDSVFMRLALIVIAVGSIFNIIFHVGTKETSTSSNLDLIKRDYRETTCDEDNKAALSSSVKSEHSNDYDNISISSSANSMQWKDWLFEPQFYQISLLYMVTRLIVNVSQVYMPMYLTDSLKLSKEYIAVVPLVVYISGFVASFVVKPVNAKLGRKWSYLLGTMTVLACCFWLFLLCPHIQQSVFGAAILLGIGGTTVTVASLSLTSDLIGENTESSAFVFGCISFADKLANGIVVEIIQLMYPCPTGVCCDACVTYYNAVMVYVVGGMTILGLITLATLAPFKVGRLRRYTKLDGECSLLLGSPTLGSPTIGTPSYGSPANHNPTKEKGGKRGSILDDNTIMLSEGFTDNTDRPHITLVPSGDKTEYVLKVKT